MPRSATRPHPPVSLQEALDVARAISEFNGGKPMNRILLAGALKASPTSSTFRYKIMASYRYGLTEGNYNSETIALTEIGTSATRPRDDNERVTAEREALRHVPVFSQLLDHFANSKVPEPQFLKNTLERPPFSIDPAWSEEVANIFENNARAVGYLRNMNGSSYLVLDAGTAPVADVREEKAHVDPEEVDGRSTTAPPEVSTPPLVQQPDPPSVMDSAPERPKPMQVFVAHGRNQKPLEQLRKILNEWQVPFVVAVDEANAGRPISEKVAELMKSCSAGIFIFSADEEFTDVSGNKIFRPSQNVIYELGAAGLLYGRKIVIFKESDVTFPSDFSDLGSIRFERDALDAKAMDLLRELIALKAVKLVSSGSE
jgi:Predicted nucleotide-binding protein containing TIR-like domain